MNKKERIQFIKMVTIYHIVTYIICGMFFSTIFNYESAWQSGILGRNMRAYDSIFTYLGPAFQLFRGLIFAGILCLFPKEFFETKYAWLKTWVCIAGLGIINTPGPSMGSIEGLIYTVTPPETFIYCIEIYVQTLWFSYLVCRISRPKKASLLKKYKLAAVTTAAVVITVMISGIILSALLKADAAAAGKDIGAMMVLLAGAILTFCFTRLYEKAPSKSRLCILLGICFLSGGVMPTLYNYIIHSPLRSPLSLIAGLISAGVTIYIVKLMMPVRVEN